MLIRICSSIIQKFVSDHLKGSSNVEKFGGPTGYDDLLQCKDIDAIYVPLPTVLKKEWAIKVLQAGKHCMIEKPVAMTADDYQQVLDAAYKAKKFILDGTMYPHHARTQQILDTVANGSIMGDVNRIETGFNFMTDAAFQETNIRARKDGDPHGAIGDLGWYCIRFAQLVFGALGSKAVTAQVMDYELTKDEVPLDCTAVVQFENGKSLWLHCGFKNHFRQHFEVCGTSKSILIDDLVLPTRAPNHFVLTSSGLTDFAVLTFHDRQVVEAESAPAHEVLLWQKFSILTRAIDETTSIESNGCGWSGDSAEILEANKFAVTTLENQKIVDALMRSIAEGKSVVSI